MILLLAVAGTGFLITLVLSRWVSSAVIAVVLGTVLSTGAIAAGLTVYLQTNDPAAPQPVVSLFMLLFLALIGAAVGRWLSDRHRPSLVKSA
jgi:hypothetical protein